MSAQHEESLPQTKHKVEGPQKHFVTYIVSILLTMLAFAAVIYGGLDKSFLMIFLVGLALVQGAFQVFVWMHAKDRGHMFPIIGIAFGLVIAFAAAAAALYWMWW